MYRNCSLAESQILEVLHLENYYHQNWCPYHLHSSLPPPPQKRLTSLNSRELLRKQKRCFQIKFFTIIFHPKSKSKRSRKHKNQNSSNHFPSTSRNFWTFFFPMCFPRFLRFFPPDEISVEDSAGGWRPRSCSWWPSLNLLKGHCNHLRKVMVKNCHGMWTFKRKKYFWVEILEWIYWNHAFEGWNSFWGIPFGGWFDCFLIWHSSPRFIPSFLRRWLQPFEKYCQLKNLRKDWGWK